MTSDVGIEAVGGDAGRRYRELAHLGPIAQLKAGRLTRRLAQLTVGLVLYGVTLAMLIRATLGNAPWDVLHQGMAIHLPISIGTAVIVMSLVVLLLWIPLRELPGLGTIANSIVVGLVADLALSLLAAPEAMWAAGRADGRWRGAQRAGDRALHRFAVRPRTTRRSDDRPAPSYGRLHPAGAHRHRGPRGRGRLAARWSRRSRHRGLRAGDRSARPADAAVLHRAAAGSWVRALSPRARSGRRGRRPAAGRAHPASSGSGRRGS